MLLIGAMVCLLAAPWVQLSVSAGDGWPHNALRHHWLMPISGHFRDCKALLVTSLTHVSGAIASVQTCSVDVLHGRLRQVLFQDLAFVRFCVTDTSSNHVTAQRVIPLRSLRPG